LQAQGDPAQSCGAQPRRSLGRYRRRASNVQPSRMRQLLWRRRIRLYLNGICSRLGDQIGAAGCGAGARSTKDEGLGSECGRRVRNGRRLTPPRAQPAVSPAYLAVLVDARIADSPCSLAPIVHRSQGVALQLIVERLPRNAHLFEHRGDVAAVPLQGLAQEIAFKAVETLRQAEFGVGLSVHML